MNNHQLLLGGDSDPGDTRYGISTVMTPTRGFSIGILSTDFCSEVEKSNTVDGREIWG